MSVLLNQLPNPTNEQRHEMLRNSLEREGRLEDYENIVNLLSPPSDITDHASPGELLGVKIGIIGGGLAGLSAAFELRKLGAEIKILDSNKDRIGGRVYTYYFDNGGKYYNEFGAHRIPVSHETTWYYINLFGLTTFPLSVTNSNNFIYVNNTRLRTSDSIEQVVYPLYALTARERNTPWKELRDYALLHILKTLPPNVRAELIQILPSYSAEYLPLTEYSVRQTFENLGLSQGAINLIAALEPGIGAILNVSYDDIVNEEYTLDYTNTYTIEDGIVNLPHAFIQSFLTERPQQYDYIPNSQFGNVIYNAGKMVTEIFQSRSTNRVVLEYKDIETSEVYTELFDYVVCAVPYSTLREVRITPHFNNLKMRAIAELNYIDSQKTLFKCNERFWETNTDYGRMFGGFSRTDLPIQYIFYPRDYALCPNPSTCSPDSPGVLAASYNFNLNATRVGNMERTLRYDLIRENVEEVHGLPRGFLNPIIETHKTVVWNNEPYIRGAFAQNLPGQKELFAYEMLQPEFNNKVYFAGEHVSTKHAWMQGSLYTGKEAANQIAHHFHNNKNNRMM